MKMAKGIIHFELDGKTALGIDTGMGARVFAQSKMAQLLDTSGCIVFPCGETEAGSVEVWKPSGVCEKETMIIWGTDFPGTCLDTLIRDTTRKDEALDAVRLWLKARAEIGTAESCCPGAQGVLIVTESTAAYPKGTLLFLPESIARRSIEAAGKDALIAAQAWVHPDLKGDDEIAFTAGAMLYAIFCGEPPFFADDEETIRQDMREGVFMPPELAAPGLDGALARLITDSITPIKKNADKNQLSVTALSGLLGNPGSKTVSSWFKPLPDAELVKIQTEQAQTQKAMERKIKIRRFLKRNKTVVLVCAAVFLVVIFSISGYVRHQAELPNTRGMAPIQVAQTYYGAFETMDHALMEACVTGKAGKNDINMVVNLFAISKIRQAYEPFAQVTDKTDFGVTDLVLKFLDADESDGEVSFEAQYTLWIPGNMSDNSETPDSGELMNNEYVPPPPVGQKLTDILGLVWHKDSWRIAEILRNEY